MNIGRKRHQLRASLPVSWIPEETRTEPSDAQIDAALNAATETYHAGKSCFEQMRAALIAARTEPSDIQIDAALRATTEANHAGKSYFEQMRAAIMAARGVETKKRAEFTNIAA